MYTMICVSMTMINQYQMMNINLERLGDYNELL